jgi:hypothetical protein
MDVPVLLRAYFHEPAAIILGAVTFRGIHQAQTTAPGAARLSQAMWWRANPLTKRDWLLWLGGGCWGEELKDEGCWSAGWEPPSPAGDLVQFRWGCLGLRMDSTGSD